MGSEEGSTGGISNGEDAGGEITGAGGGEGDEVGRGNASGGGEYFSCFIFLNVFKRWRK